jgi:hypothetical protein
MVARDAFSGPEAEETAPEKHQESIFSDRAVGRLICSAERPHVRPGCTVIRRPSGRLNRSRLFVPCTLDAVRLISMLRKYPARRRDTCAEYEDRRDNDAEDNRRYFTPIEHSVSV